MSRIVADSSPLISLAAAGYLQLLEANIIPSTAPHSDGAPRIRVSPVGVMYARM